MLALTKKERNSIIVLAGCLLLGMALSAWQRHGDAKLLKEIENTYAAEDKAYSTMGAAGSPGIPGATPSALASAVSDSLRINVNKATAKELEQLPRIGPVISGRIIEYRTKNGPFKSVEDLVKVKGIGAKTLERIRPFITVD